MNKSKAYFQRCPDCGDGINPISNICSCGYKIPKVEMTQFESPEEHEKNYIRHMKELLNYPSPEFIKFIDKYNTIKALDKTEIIGKLRTMIKNYGL